MPGSPEYGDTVHRGPHNLPRWRSHAKDFSRRPLLVKQVTYLAIVLIIILPLWYFNRIRADSFATQITIEHPTEDSSPPLALDVHNVIPHYGHNSPGHHANQPAIPVPPPLQEEPQPSSTPSPSVPEIPTFAFIMWETSSAKEGALLIKVRQGNSKLSFRRSAHALPSQS